MATDYERLVISKRLAKIRQRCQAATSECWYYTGGTGGWIGTAAGDGIAQMCDRYGEDFANADNNAEFIAHSRADVAWLVEEVERLRALLLGDTTPTGAAAAGVGA